MKYLNLKKQNSHILISIVALIECLLLIMVTTYSWIESASSLVIKGMDLPVSDNLNYLVTLDSTSKNIVDLSSYFSSVPFFQFAKASSPDGKTFYFPKSNSTNTVSGYRLGDTTDFNTSYYNIAFNVYNKTGNTYDYYFGTEDFVTLKSDESILTDDILEEVSSAFKISVTVGTGGTPVIYSKKATATDVNSYKPVNSTDGSFASTNLTPEDIGSFVYDENSNSSSDYVFTAVGNTYTPINIRIWFEEQDPSFTELTDDQKEAVLGATVNVDVSFINSESDFKVFYFDDYIFSTLSSNYGNPITTDFESSGYKMYFKYTYSNDNNEEVTNTQVMSIDANSTNPEATRWVTSDENGNPTACISASAITNIDYANSYFYYGTESTEKYKWNLPSAPCTNDNGEYVYRALSYTQTSASNKYSFGLWDDAENPDELSLVYFKDLTTSYVDSGFNSESSQIITQKAKNNIDDNYQMHTIYATSNLTAVNATNAKSAISFYYDKEEEVFKAYVPNSYLESLYFFYCQNGYFGATNAKLRWNAGSPSQTDGKYIYTALGYTANKAISGLLYNNDSNTSLGTWGEVEKIKLSTELLDSTVSSSYRFKINVPFDDGNRYSYYMSTDGNNLESFAYVPKDSGNSASNVITFDLYNNSDLNTIVASYNKDNNWLREGSDTYYATSFNTRTASGQWQMAVLVDGTTDNLINALASGTDYLQYSIGESNNYQNMVKIDNYRWYVPYSNNSIYNSGSTINYRWTAYASAGDSDPGTVFNYTHNLSDGIYLTVTE